MKGTPQDPRALISEAYRIDGITISECRSIFLDWALFLPDDVDLSAAATNLHARFCLDHPDHPMTEVLAEGRSTAQPKGRRGGASARARSRD